MTIQDQLSLPCSLIQLSHQLSYQKIKMNGVSSMKQNEIRIPQEQTPNSLPQWKSHLTTARDTFDMENGYVNRVWPYISTLSSPFSFSFRTTYMISWHRYHTPNPPTPCIIWHIFLHYPLNHYTILLLKSQLYFSSAYDHTKSTLSSPFWFCFRISFRTKQKKINRVSSVKQNQMRIPQEQTPNWLPRRKSHLSTAWDIFDIENGYINRVWPYISTLSYGYESYSFRTYLMNPIPPFYVIYYCMVIRGWHKPRMTIWPHIPAILRYDTHDPIFNKSLMFFNDFHPRMTKWPGRRVWPYVII